MIDADRLAAVAVELAVRVRDDDPQDNAAWLDRQAPTATDLRNLCIVLAAAVPDDQPWTALTAWTGELTTQPRRLTKPATDRPGLKPCGTRAAYRRHRRRGEESCQPCRDAAARYKRGYETTRRTA